MAVSGLEGMGALTGFAGQVFCCWAASPKQAERQHLRSAG